MYSDGVFGSGGVALTIEPDTKYTQMADADEADVNLSHGIRLAALASSPNRARISMTNSLIFGVYFIHPQPIPGGLVIRTKALWAHLAKLEFTAGDRGISLSSTCTRRDLVHPYKAPPSLAALRIGPIGTAGRIELVTSVEREMLQVTMWYYRGMASMLRDPLVDAAAKGCNREYADSLEYSIGAKLALEEQRAPIKPIAGYRPTVEFENEVAYANFMLQAYTHHTLRTEGDYSAACADMERYHAKLRPMGRHYATPTLLSNVMTTCAVGNNSIEPFVDMLVRDRNHEGAQETFFRFFLLYTLQFWAHANRRFFIRSELDSEHYSAALPPHILLLFKDPDFALSMPEATASDEKKTDDDSEEAAAKRKKNKIDKGLKFWQSRFHIAENQGPSADSSSTATRPSFEFARLVPFRLFFVSTAIYCVENHPRIRQFFSREERSSLVDAVYQYQRASLMSNARNLFATARFQVLLPSQRFDTDALDGTSELRSATNFKSPIVTKTVKCYMTNSAIMEQEKDMDISKLNLVKRMMPLWLTHFFFTPSEPIMEESIEDKVAKLRLYDIYDGLTEPPYEFRMFPTETEITRHKSYLHHRYPSEELPQRLAEVDTIQSVLQDRFLARAARYTDRKTLRTYFHDRLSQRRPYLLTAASYMLPMYQEHTFTPRTFEIPHRSYGVRMQQRRARFLIQARYGMLFKDSAILAFLPVIHMHRMDYDDDTYARLENVKPLQREAQFWVPRTAAKVDALPDHVPSPIFSLDKTAFYALYYAGSVKLAQVLQRAPGLRQGVVLLSRFGPQAQYRGRGRYVEIYSPDMMLAYTALQGNAPPRRPPPAAHHVAHPESETFTIEAATNTTGWECRMSWTATARKDAQLMQTQLRILQQGITKSIAWTFITVEEYMQYMLNATHSEVEKQHVRMRFWGNVIEVYRLLHFIFSSEEEIIFVLCWLFGATGSALFQETTPQWRETIDTVFYVLMWRAHTELSTVMSASPVHEESDEAVHSGSASDAEWDRCSPFQPTHNTIRNLLNSEQRTQIVQGLHIRSVPAEALSEEKIENFALYLLSFLHEQNAADDAVIKASVQDFSARYRFQIKSDSNHYCSPHMPRMRGCDATSLYNLFFAFPRGDMPATITDPSDARTHLTAEDLFVALVNRAIQTLYCRYVRWAYHRFPVDPIQLSGTTVRARDRRRTPTWVEIRHRPPPQIPVYIQLYQAVLNQMHHSEVTQGIAKLIKESRSKGTHKRRQIVSGKQQMDIRDALNRIRGVAEAAAAAEDPSADSYLRTAPMPANPTEAGMLAVTYALFHSDPDLQKHLEPVIATIGTNVIRHLPQYFPTWDVVEVGMLAKICTDIDTIGTVSDTLIQSLLHDIGQVTALALRMRLDPLSTLCDEILREFITALRELSALEGDLTTAMHRLQPRYRTITQQFRVPQLVHTLRASVFPSMGKVLLSPEDTARLVCGPRAYLRVYEALLQVLKPPGPALLRDVRADSLCIPNDFRLATATREGILKPAPAVERQYDMMQLEEVKMQPLLDSPVNSPVDSPLDGGEAKRADDVEDVEDAEATDDDDIPTVAPQRSDARPAKRHRRK